MNDILDRAEKHTVLIALESGSFGVDGREHYGWYVKSKPDALRRVVMTGDDFAIGNTGLLYVTTHPENSVVRLDMSDTVGRERSWPHHRRSIR